jgi:GNAT superfamily N-acetyltransferase
LNFDLGSDWTVEDMKQSEIQNLKSKIGRPVVIRRATKADAGKIAEFAAALAEQHVGYDPVRFSRLITREGAERYYGSRTVDDNATVLLAEIDGRAVGFAYMEYEPVLYAELATRVAWLHDIYVEPDSRSGGGGNALMEAVQKEAKNSGADKILLSVAAKNSFAQQFFERRGFRTTMLEMMLDLS